MEKHNIQEDEIQVLGTSIKKQKRRMPWRIIIAGILLLLIVVIGSLYYFLSGVNGEEESPTEPLLPYYLKGSIHYPEELEEKRLYRISSGRTSQAYVDVLEETVNDVPLSVYIPHNAQAELMLERPDITDSTIVFATQAADVGTDLKTLIGDYVLAGEQIARGKSKQGFCAIIGGEITLGVGPSTPLLDKAIETNGFFFRQYPLVSKSQMIENKPKGKAIRRALGKRDDETVIVESRSRESFHDFAQALVDIGVTEAIYLVGGNSYGWYMNRENEINRFGSIVSDRLETKNYIVWRGKIR